MFESVLIVLLLLPVKYKAGLTALLMLIFFLRCDRIRQRTPHAADILVGAYCLFVGVQSVISGARLVSMPFCGYLLAFAAYAFVRMNGDVCVRRSAARVQLPGMILVFFSAVAITMAVLDIPLLYLMNKNILASWTIGLLFLTFYAHFMNNCRPGLIRLAAGSLIVMTAFAVYGSYIGSLALVAAAALFFFFCAYIHEKKLIGASFGVVCAACTACILGTGAYKPVMDFFAADIRMPVWLSTRAMAAQTGLLGIGIGNFYRYFPSFRIPEYFLYPRCAVGSRHALSEPLEILVEQGWAGFILTTGILIWLLFKTGSVIADTSRTKKIRLAMLALFCGMTGLVLHSMFDDNMSLGIQSRLLFAVTAALMVNCFESERCVKGFCLQAVSFRITRFVCVCLCAVILCVSSLCTVSRVLQMTGNARLAAGDTAGAARAFKTRVLVDPLEAQGYYSLAGVYAACGSLKDALLVYEALEEVSPDYAQVHLNKGVIAKAMGYPKISRIEFNKELSLNPYHQETRRHLIHVLALLGKDREREREQRRKMLYTRTLYEMRRDLTELRGSFYYSWEGF